MPGRYRAGVPGQREIQVRDPVPGIVRGDPGPDPLPPDADVRVMSCPARLRCHLRRQVRGLVLCVRCRPVPCHLECCDDVADGAGTGAEGAVTRAGAIAALEVPPHDPVAGHPAVGAGQQQAGCFGAGQPADVLTGYWG